VRCEVVQDGTGKVVRVVRWMAIRACWSKAPTTSPLRPRIPAHGIPLLDQFASPSQGSS